MLGEGMGGGGGIGAWVSTQVHAVELQASTGCRRARLTYLPLGQLRIRSVSGSRSLDTREKAGAQRAFSPILLSPALSLVSTVLQQAFRKSELS